MRPLKPEIINEALKRHLRLSVRAEEVKKYGELFVDPNILDVVLNNQKQVVFGRRGSGKTALLGTIAENPIFTTPDGLKVLTLMFSGSDLMVSPDIDQNLPADKAKAYAYFQNFVTQLAEKLTKSVELVLDTHGFMDLFVRLGKSKRGEIETKILQVLDYVRQGERFWYPLGSWSEKQQLDVTQTHGHSLGADATALATGLGGTVIVRGKLSGGKKSETRKTSTRVVQAEGQMMVRISSIRKRLLEIIDLLGIDYLLIALDEWMALDATARTDIQPEFAELLKRFLFATDKIGVKIGTNWYQTKFFNPTKCRGLETDADIYIVASLDWSLLDEKDLRSFYEKLIYKRLKLVQGEVSFFEDPRDTCRPTRALTDSIFKDEHAFLELVHGAQGLPRNFIMAFNEASSRIGCNVVRRQMDFVLIRDCIRSKSVTGRMRDIGTETIGEAFLWRYVKPVIEQSGVELFLIRKKDMNSLESAIQESVRARLIYEYPELNLPADVRQNYKAYVLDYGTFLDWERSIQYANPSLRDRDLANNAVVPVISPGDQLDRYVVKYKPSSSGSKRT
ncbi:hypothetical protein ACFLTN_06365 [Chloroflexota bacterium]